MTENIDTKLYILNNNQPAKFSFRGLVLKPKEMLKALKLTFQQKRFAAKYLDCPEFSEIIKNLYENKLSKAQIGQFFQSAIRNRKVQILQIKHIYKQFSYFRESMDEIQAKVFTTLDGKPIVDIWLEYLGCEFKFLKRLSPERKAHLARQIPDKQRNKLEKAHINYHRKLEYPNFLKKMYFNVFFDDSKSK